MRNVLQMQFQDVVELETIYEQYKHSPRVSKAKDASALTGALVGTFEQWMKPEAKAEGAVAVTSSSQHLAEVAGDLLQQQKVLTA